MRIAMIGSRSLQIEDLGPYLESENLLEKLDELVSGGAKGIDSRVKSYALKNQIRLTEFLPEYHEYGRAAPIRRNIQIVQYSDFVIAFWDGKSRGTKFVIDYCRKTNVPVKVILLEEGTETPCFPNQVKK